MILLIVRISSLARSRRLQQTASLLAPLLPSNSPFSPPIAVGRPSEQDIILATANHTIVIPVESPLMNPNGLAQLPVDQAIEPALSPTDTPADDDEQSDSSSSVWSSISSNSELNFDEWFLMERTPDAPEIFRVFDTPNLPGRGII